MDFMGCFPDVELVKKAKSVLGNLLAVEIITFLMSVGDGLSDFVRRFNSQRVAAGGQPITKSFGIDARVFQTDQDVGSTETLFLKGLLESFKSRIIVGPGTSSFNGEWSCRENSGGKRFVGNINTDNRGRTRPVKPLKDVTVIRDFVSVVAVVFSLMEMEFIVVGRREKNQRRRGGGGALRERAFLPKRNDRQGELDLGVEGER